MSTPLISVVMPVHNGLPHLSEAISSILAQSFSDFEFICIDDGSTDGSAEALTAVQDPRWRLVRNRKQAGLSAALNRGLRLARGKYWARMDADDISLPRRLELQAAFLEQHPEISLVGAWAQTFGGEKEQVWKLPTHPEALKAEMLFNSPLVHSAIMLRRTDFLAKRLRYNPSVTRAQDYELWERAAQQLQLANLPRVLLRYRLHAGQVGQQDGAGQAKTAASVRARQLKRLGMGAGKQELQLHNEISTWQFDTHSTFLRRVEAWLGAIERANHQAQQYDPTALHAALERRWWAVCRGAAKHNPASWTMYRSSDLAHAAPRNLIDKAVFWAKAQWLH
ncbi:MAG: glycosyltransferase [Anaerolineales bacterium]|nr:glycosyltransferase [Anaerolineales bacterium]